MTKYYINSIGENLIPFIKNQRNKRGLIDGLGTVIKQITGNMDSQDNVKIQQLLKTLKRNQVTIFQQLDNQYSVNSKIINKFNETILDIKHNEQTLLGQIDLLNLMLTADSKNFEILFAENLLNQIIYLFNIILDLTRDIRTSLTLCGTNTVHPSIITNQELAKEMTKLNSKYADELPFKINGNNIQKYLKLIKPNCRIVETEIVYFLTLPLFDPKQYRLFHLFPVPNVHFQAIIPTCLFISRRSTPLPNPDEITHYLNLRKGNYS
jgi:hypothetical protein